MVTHAYVEGWDLLRVWMLAIMRLPQHDGDFRAALGTAGREMLELTEAAKQGPIVLIESPEGTVTLGFNEEGKMFMEVTPSPASADQDR